MENFIFSFFGHVFMDNQTDLQEVEKKLILEHEAAHIEQYHWIDILFAQIVCSLQWFNPFAWMYLHSVKQNHEFLADRSIIEKGYSPAVYYAVLINNTFRTPVFALTNSFSYYNKFKRITMMKKNVSNPVKKLAGLLLVPALAGFLWAFAKPEYKYNVSVQQGSKTIVVNDTINKPLMIVDGKEVSSIDFSPDNIFSVNVLKGDAAVSAYGDKGKNGVISALTKKYAAETGEDTVLVNKNYSVTKVKDTKSSVLYILDDKEVLPEEIKNLSPDKIESISVLKGEAATKIYGEKAKKGVIVIVTKKEVEQ